MHILLALLLGAAVVAGAGLVLRPIAEAISHVIKSKGSPDVQALRGEVSRLTSRVNGLEAQVEELGHDVRALDEGVSFMRQLKGG